MEPEDLGYTKKWIEYGLIDHDILKVQFSEYMKGEDIHTEHYRYGSFLNWLRSKQVLSDTEIGHYLELAFDDDDLLMAGSAVKELFCSEIITDSQFQFIKQKLPAFGDWTKKLINRESLRKSIFKSEISAELFDLSLQHQKEFKDNSLIELIIKKSTNATLLNLIIAGNHSKRLKNSAAEKLKKI
jgi:hypothetical protein